MNPLIVLGKFNIFFVGVAMVVAVFNKDFVTSIVFGILFVVNFIIYKYVSKIYEKSSNTSISDNTGNDISAGDNSVDTDIAQ